MTLIYRADYWKSQAKKYCEFCKCWLADNRPSVEFHENGRKHKENVARRLQTITKQSRKDHKESERMESDLRKMEAAALEAYRKDVENNADITSRSINEKLQENNLAIADESTSGCKVWKETMSPDGESYYWNILTNETVWVAPKEGYMSFADQKANADTETQKQLQKIQKQRIVNDKVRAEEEKQIKEEERAAKEREKMKVRKNPEDEMFEKPSPGPIIPPGKTEPYGQWRTIRTNVVPVDLQLPEHTCYPAEPVIVAEPEPKQKEFKEKKMQSLDGVGESSFKKRKGISNAKRNVRQRFDDD